MTHDTVPVNAASTEAFPLWRYAIAAGAILALGVVVIARMVIIQVGPERDDLTALAKDKYEEVVIKPRGLIFDSEGHLLAGDRKSYEVDILLKDTPAEVLPILAREVGTVLRLDVDDLARKLLTHKQAGIPAVRVAPSVSEEQKQMIEERIEALSATNEDLASVDLSQSVAFLRSMERFYPEGDLAANVLGFVAWGEDRGYEGVEQYYDNLLRGGVEWVKHSYVPWQEGEDSQIQNNAPTALYLTIDRALQHAAEEEAWRAVHDNQATSATIIVMEPYTGEILAMAVYPRPNLNDYEGIQAYREEWNDAFNLALERAYEPGSVFKIVTMAAAVDLGTVTPQTQFEDVGSYHVPGRTVYNWDRGAWGQQTMVTCLQHSLNTCLAWVAVEKVGQDRFYDYLQAFGFGRRTGIDLAGEAPGYYRHPGGNEWSYSDFASQSFGQAILVTPVQMAAAAAAIANGGYLVTPHVLRYGVVHGQAYNYHPPAQRQVISEETSRIMRQMLKESLQGESSAALVPGYSVAGKTGTAEIAENGGYVTSDTNASFVGWFPAEEPQYLIYVWLERPKRSKWASIVAAPVFARMVQRVAALEHVPPDKVREQIDAVANSQAQP